MLTTQRVSFALLAIVLLSPEISHAEFTTGVPTPRPTIVPTPRPTVVPTPNPPGGPGACQPSSDPYPQYVCSCWFPNARSGAGIRLAPSNGYVTTSDMTGESCTGTMPAGSPYTTGSPNVYCGATVPAGTIAMGTLNCVQSAVGFGR